MANNAQNILYIAGATVVMTVASSVYPAFAQTTSDVAHRLDRIERDLSIMSQQVYRGETPPAGYSPPTYDDGSSSAVADMQVRLDSLENSLRSLNGTIDEQNYKIGQLQEQLNKILTDNEVRFKQLEQNAASASSSQVTSTATPNETLSPQLTSDAQPSSTISNPPQPKPINNSSGKATQMYDDAFAFIRAGNYSKAEVAFIAYLKEFPNDKLSANAEYWLGETYYVRGQFEKAATAFAKGYQNHPKSAKAADNLLKLSMALGSLKRKDDACLALQQLEADFPKATASVTDRVKQEKSKLGCK